MAEDNQFGQLAELLRMQRRLEELQTQQIQSQGEWHQIVRDQGRMIGRLVDLVQRLSERIEVLEERN